MDDKILTIIVPAYNMEWCIEKNLKTYVSPKLLGALSVIVLDNSSEDDTFLIAKRLEQSYPEIFTCITKRNDGYGSSVNMGISMSQTKYVRIIDADDWVDTEELENFIEHIKDCDADIIQTPFRKVDFKSGVSSFVDIGNEKSFSSVSCLDIRQKVLPCLHSSTFKCELLKMHPFSLLENTYYVDEELAIIPFFYAKTISYFHDNVYCYLVNNDAQSTSVINTVKHISDRERVIKYVLLTYKESEVDEENDYFCRRRIALSVGNHYTTLYIVHNDRSVGRRLAKEYTVFLKDNYPAFYSMVRKKRYILYLFNLLNINVDVYERIKAFFRSFRRKHG